MNVMYIYVYIYIYIYIYYWHCDDVNTRSIRTLSDGSIGKQFSKKKKKKEEERYIFKKRECFSFLQNLELLCLTRGWED